MIVVAIWQQRPADPRLLTFANFEEILNQILARWRRRAHKDVQMARKSLWGLIVEFFIEKTINWAIPYDVIQRMKLIKKIKLL